MSKKLFTEEEVKTLRSNKYIKAASPKGVTYTDGFKRLFIIENEKGKFPREIFEEIGLPIDILGKTRIMTSGKRWRFLFSTSE
ncbi:hypothetical protein ABID56_002219 [Alkalibacillus flavidus]|uniref:Transposase n=1 Tax=Alkalibacillus flavidus TaxID=546021 RepID=A0ABV2KWY1_9BACI